MAKQKRSAPRATQSDSAYFLKLVMYLILGSLWVFLIDFDETKQIPIPLGLILGLLFTSHEHFKIDRKIEYAVLLVATFVGFWTSAGIFITVL